MTETHWFAFKVFYNRVFDTEALLQQQQLETYIPLQTIVTELPSGERITQVKPVVNSLLFMRATTHKAKEMQAMLGSRAMLYTRHDAEGRRIPAAIPDREMQIFRLVVERGAGNLELLDEAEASRFHHGQHVRVIDGIFAGAEGYIKRIHGDHRLVVSIHGICAVATCYIPQRFLEPFDK